MKPSKKGSVEIDLPDFVLVIFHGRMLDDPPSAADDVSFNLMGITVFRWRRLEFYKRGICPLPERWQKVIDNNGQYLIK